MPARGGRGRKGPSTKEQEIGHRVRLRRLIVGMSQERLGGALGITFQQVQKYEKGTNRISATRLEGIARVLGVPITYFYGRGQDEGADRGLSESGAPYIADFPLSSEGVNLIRAFGRITDPKVRRRILGLVKAIADSGSSSS